MLKRLASLLVMLALVAIALPGFAATSSQKHTVVGDISWVSSSTNALTIKVKNETERFSVDAKAEILSHGKTLKLTDLKSGERVEVTYTGTDTDRTASRITVLSSHSS